MISIDEINKSLKTKYIAKRIYFYEETDSTNLEAKRLINCSKAGHGDVVIAKKQSSGKGQQDNIWESPQGGIYLSVISAIKADKGSNLITFTAGIACKEGIEKGTGVKTRLKWVNDIYYKDQKLGGILVQTTTQGSISTHITGIGINVSAKVSLSENSTNKPAAISEIISGEPDINLIIAEILNKFEKNLEVFQINKEKIVQKWLEYADISGKRINFTDGNQLKSGIIRGVNEFGHLSVESEGKEIFLTSTRNNGITYL